MSKLFSRASSSPATATSARDSRRADTASGNGTGTGTGTNNGRRGFLGWCLGGGSSLPLVAGPIGASLGACTLWDSSSTSAPQIDLTVLDQPRNAVLSAQVRAVQWVPGRSPAQPNAWAYVTPSAGSGVLPNHLGPTFNAATLPAT
jgi:hypothetical protein